MYDAIFDRLKQNLYMIFRKLTDNRATPTT